MIGKLENVPGPKEYYYRGEGRKVADGNPILKHDEGIKTKALKKSGKENSHGGMPGNVKLKIPLGK